MSLPQRPDLLDKRRKSFVGHVVLAKRRNLTTTTLIFSAGRARSPVIESTVNQRRDDIWILLSAVSWRRPRLGIRRWLCTYVLPDIEDTFGTRVPSSLHTHKRNSFPVSASSFPAVYSSFGRLVFRIDFKIGR